MNERRIDGCACVAVCAPTIARVSLCVRLQLRVQEDMLTVSGKKEEGVCLRASARVL